MKSGLWVTIIAIAAVTTMGAALHLKDSDETGISPKSNRYVQNESAKPQVSVLGYKQEQTRDTSPTVTVFKSRADQIDRLAKGTPSQALEAVKILQACANVSPYTQKAVEAADSKVKALLEQIASTTHCDGITPGQRAQIIPLAIKAAAARLPGAFAQLFAMTSQDKSIRNDPRVELAWEDIFDANIKAADPDALMARFQYESNCSDPPKCTGRDLASALVYWTAYVDAHGLKYGTDQVTPNITGIIGKEKARASIEQGHALYLQRSQS